MVTISSIDLYYNNNYRKHVENTCIIWFLLW